MLKFDNSRLTLLLLATIVVITAFIAVPIANSAPRAQEHSPTPTSDKAIFDAGFLLYKSERYGLAIEQFRLLLRDYPGSEWADDAQYYIAESYYYEKDYARAAVEYQELIENYPSSEWVGNDVQYYIGESYELSGDCDEAIIEYQEFLAAYPSSKWADESQASIGNCYYRQGEFDRAKEAFQALIAHYPDSEYVIGARQLIANIEDGTAFQLVREEKAKTGRTLTSAGEVYEYLGRYQEALGYFWQALDIARETSDPMGEGRALNGIGLVYSDLGQYQEALDIYQQALDIARGTGDWMGAGRVLNNIGAVYGCLAQYQEELGYYQQALVVRKEISDLAGEGVTLQNIGGVYCSLGQYQEALGYFHQALAIARQVYDQVFEGRVLVGIGVVYRHLGQYQEALDYYQQALAVARQTYGAGEATVLGNIGELYLALGKYQEALDTYQQALAVAQELGARPIRAPVLAGIGAVYRDLGQYQKALNYFQQALAIVEEIGDRAGKGKTLNNIGQVYYDLGQYQESIRHYQQALIIQQQIGDRTGAGGTLNGIGSVYYGLGQYQEALGYYQKALTICREIGNQAGEATTLNNMGEAYRSLGQYQDALRHLRQALDFHLEVSNQTGEGTTLNNIGLVYRSLGQYQEALDYFQQALVIVQGIGDRTDEGAVLNNIGLIYWHLRQYQEALDYYQEALTIWQEIGNPAGEETTLSNIGYLYWQQGQYQEALDHYLKAITILEEIRSEMTVEELKTAVAADGVATNIYKRTVLLFVQLIRPTDAFNYTERAKTRTFLDQLANQRIDPRGTSSPELIAQEQDLRIEIQALDKRLYEERAKPLDQQSQDVLQTVSANLEAKRRAYEELWVKLKLANPEYASLYTVDPLTLPQVQALLDTQTTLIEYFVTADKTIVFIVSQHDFHTVEIPVTQKFLAGRVSYFREMIQTQHLEADKQSATALYDLLVQPLLSHLKTPILCIIPHGVLHYLPFQALNDGQHWLIENYTLFYSPSASVLEYAFAKRKTQADNLLAFGNPQVEGLRPLRYSEQEVRTIASLYGIQAVIGPEATESHFRTEAGHYALLHIAAHSSFNVHSPLFSAMHLASDEKNDGRLEVHEIYNLNLKSANLVVLSACQSQLGELTRGDELVGLSRAFIYAGTPSVVASLWAVDDEATSILMEMFYCHLRDGLNKAEALRQAQIEVMEIEKYSSPFYWAAFNLVGDHGGEGREKIEGGKATATPVKGQKGEQVMPTPMEEAAEAARGAGICAALGLSLGLVAAAAWVRQRTQQGRSR